MHFTFVTDELPEAGLAGHLALNHAIISWLRTAGHQVTIILVRPRLRWPVQRYILAAVTGPGIRLWQNRVIAARPRDAGRIVLKRLLAALPVTTCAALRRLRPGSSPGSNNARADAVLGAFITREQSRGCAANIARLAPDAVLVDTIFRAAVLRESALQGLNSLIIAHDVFFLRHRALTAAGYKVLPRDLPREMEASLLSSANVIAAIQPEEASLIRAMCPGKTVCVTPMPALPHPRPAGILRLPGRLVFVGSAALPNLDGLRWFLADIWPRLRIWLGSITLDLVGDCGAALSHLPPGVARLGRVENLSGILHRSALAISPLRVGSGLKIKMLDYARHGLLTIATPASLQGFAASRTAPFIAAANASTFTSAIAANLQTSAYADEQRALDYIAANYSFERCFSGLSIALKLPATTLQEPKLA
jgi:succinoglycan biosynthesis protein ExoO